MLRLAQITDLHLRWHQAGTSDSPRRLSRQMPELFAELLERLTTAEVDLLVLTGDLLDVPDEGRDEPAIEADYVMLRSQLDSSGLAYTVMTGNHDLEPAMRRVWPDQPRTLDLSGYRIHSFWDLERPDHVPYRPAEERARFDAVLAEDVTQIHLQHYLIAPDLPDARWPYNYEEAAELREAIVASGHVLLCLAGHYHIGLPSIVDGFTTFAAGPAFAVAPHRYRIYTLEGETISMIEHAVR